MNSELGSNAGYPTTAHQLNTFGCTYDRQTSADRLRPNDLLTSNSGTMASAAQGSMLNIVSGGYDNDGSYINVSDIREEKQQMTHKLDEFASMLRQF